jgi:UDP-glucose 4-epimerase
MTVYLVTGGAGFIGSHLATTLAKMGHEVRIIDNFATGNQANLAHLDGQYDLFKLDIAHDDLAPAMQGVDYVLHQAAIPSVPRSVDDPLTTHEGCATGTLRVLIAARDAGVKRVVYAASSSAYGDIEGKYKVEDMAPRPMSPYAVAKLTGEYYCTSFHQVYGLETVALRYFNVFGPRQDPHSPYSAVIPLFGAAMLDGQAPTIYGDGTQSRDFTFIDNVVRGNLLACTADGSKVGGQVINVACGGSISLLDLMDSLNKLLGTQIEPRFAPPRAGDVKHSCADIHKAGELLGYEPIVGFEEGLKRTLEWLTQKTGTK